MLDWRKWPVQDIPSISKSLWSLTASCWSSLLKREYWPRASPEVHHERGRASLRQPGLPEPLIVSLHESAVFRVIGRRAFLDRADRGGRADLLADSQGRACFVPPTEE